MRPSGMLEQELRSTDLRFGPLLDRMVALLQEVRAVAAVAVGGSIAAGDADQYSDLDLECVVDEVTDDLAAAVRDAVHASYAVGDERWAVPGRILSTAGTNWLRVDVALVARAEGVSKDAIVVWSRGDGVFRRREAYAFERDPEALSRLVSRFLRSIGLIVRDLHRGDLRLGCWATEFLVNELITLMYLQGGIVRGAQKGTYAQLSREDVAVLQHLPVAVPERQSIITAQLAVAEEYLGRARHLADDWNAAWPVAMEQGTRAFLLENLGATFRGSQLGYGDS